MMTRIVYPLRFTNSVEILPTTIIRFLKRTKRKTNYGPSARAVER